MDQRTDRPDDVAPAPEPLPTPPLAPAPRRRGRAPVVLAIVATLLGAAVIAAIVAGGGEDAPDAAASPSIEADTRPATPGGLKAQPGPFRVVLTWTHAGPAPDGFTVYRNGETIGIAEGSERRFVDLEALPATGYRYVVKAYAGEIVTESTGAAATVRTPAASLALARLQGVFEVRLKVASSFGLSDVTAETGAWRLTPLCDEGPCRVRFGDLNGPTPNMDLAQRSAVYDGEVSGASGWACGDVTSNATSDVHLRIEEADAVAGQWRATKVAGTLVISIAEQLGCRAGGVTYDVTGVLHTGP